MCLTERVNWDIAGGLEAALCTLWYNDMVT